MKAEWTNSDSLTTSQTTKAILVIKLPEQADIKNLLVSYRVFDRTNKNHEVMKGAKGLIPLPQKMRTDEDDIEEDSYWQGWNECIDAIVGETE